MLSYAISSNSVFELVEAEVTAIANYLGSGDRSLLDDPLEKISKADEGSKQHPLVRYYEAIIQDLLGKFDQAEEIFSSLEQQAIDDDIKKELQSNIGVVQFQKVRRDTTTLPNRILDLRSRHAKAAFGHLTASLAGKDGSVPKGTLDEPQQMMNALRAIYPDDSDPTEVAHRQAFWARYLALQCIPEVIDNAKKKPDERHRLAANHAAAISAADTVLKSSKPPKLSDAQRRRWDEAVAIAHNAKGRAEMYYTDYLRHPEERIRRLEAALLDLQAANNSFKDDWSYNCDIGSCLMRLGHWRDSRADLEEAAAQIGRVLNVRSDYGFAIYELGRIHRLLKDRDGALRYLGRASQLPDTQRGVSKERIAREIELAQEPSTAFP